MALEREFLDKEYSRFTRSRSLFYSYLLGSAGIALAIHVGVDSGDGRDLRLGLAVIFFGSLLTFLWALTDPLHEYLTNAFAWRYQDCGPDLKHTVKLMVFAITRYIREIAYILMVAVSVLSLRVFAAWDDFDFLESLVPILEWAWWLSLLALPLYLLATKNRAAEILQRVGAVNEHVYISDKKPIDEMESRRRAADAVRPPVSVLGAQRFRAGGFDWTWDDFYKNSIVFGQSGSGKTVCVLNALLDGLIASTAPEVGTLPASGLILDPKGDFRDKIRLLCRKYGREQDLLILDPSDKASVRWNPLDSTDDELEIAARFAAVLEILGMKNEQDSFWIDSAKTFIRHAIALIRATNAPGEPPSFSDVMTIATNLDKLIARSEKVPDESVSGLSAIDYFKDTWNEMADKTRTSVQSYLVNMIDPFLIAPYNEVFSGRSTVSVLDTIDAGKILYVYMPIADKEAMSRTVSTFVKLSFFREVLKRPGKSRPSFFLCDEFQAFFTHGAGKGDADFFERSRQSNHANIIAIQNLYALLKQTPNENPVMNLLGNCAVKFFLRNTDDKTNDYASKLFGERLEVLFPVQTSVPGAGLPGIRDHSGGMSGSAAYGAQVRKEVFAQLAQPSRPEGIQIAETVVHLASRAAVSSEKLRWKIHPLTEN